MPHLVQTVESSMGEQQSPLSNRGERPLSDGPSGLSAHRFTVGGERFLLLSFDAPRNLSCSAGALDRLSAPEKAIAEFLIEGCSLVEIGRRRSRSLHTVRKQVKAIFEKLSVHSRVELLQLCTGASLDKPSAAPESP